MASQPETPLVVETAISDWAELFGDVLADGGCVTFSPRGASMLPMLRAYGDSVTLVSPDGSLKLGSVALFVTKDGRYILHRLVRRKNGMLLFCGDNRIEWDEPILSNSVIGVLSSYSSRGKNYSVNSFFYRLYSSWMVATARMKRPALAIWKFIYRLFKL